MSIRTQIEAAEAEAAFTLYLHRNVPLAVMDRVERFELRTKDAGLSLFFRPRVLSGRLDYRLTIKMTFETEPAGVDQILYDLGFYYIHENEGAHVYLPITFEIIPPPFSAKPFDDEDVKI